jgi:hypothetical protein
MKRGTNVGLVMAAMLGIGIAIGACSSAGAPEAAEPALPFSPAPADTLNCTSDAQCAGHTAWVTTGCGGTAPACHYTFGYANCQCHQNYCRAQGVRDCFPENGYCGLYGSTAWVDCN